MWEPARGAQAAHVLRNRAEQHIATMVSSEKIVADFADLQGITEKVDLRH